MKKSNKSEEFKEFEESSKEFEKLKDFIEPRVI